MNAGGVDEATVSVEPWDCLSCGARAQSKQFCETCGAAMPVDGEDSALSMMLGLVCENCDTFNDPGVGVCTTCASPLGEGAPLGDAVSDAPLMDEEPLVTPMSGTPRPISGVGVAADRADDLAAIGDGIELAPTTEPAPAPAMPAPPVAATGSAASGAPAAPPSWMSAPTGQPLATQFAMPKVDLAAVAREGQGLTAPKPANVDAKLASAAAAAQMRPTATPLATPMPAPAPTPTAFNATACWRCGVNVEREDKFCRNCGARADGPNVASAGLAAPSPLATTQIAALKMPSPVMPAGATMVMPAMRAAQQAAADLPAGGDARLAASGGVVGAGATLMFSAQTGERHAKLILVRGQSQHGSQWRLSAAETWLGRAPPAGSHDAVMFPDDRAIARAHCRLVFHGTELWLEPEETLNGVFLRVREPMRLADGDEMVVGAQRLRVMAEADRPAVIAPDETAQTRTLGSLVRQAPRIMLMRIASEPVLNEVFHRCQRLLTIGRNNCDLNFPRDSFVSERHAQLTHEGSALVLEDLRSRNGTYVRARYATKLAHGDLVLLGDKVLRVELPR